MKLSSFNIDVNSFYMRQSTGSLSLVFIHGVSRVSPSWIWSDDSFKFEKRCDTEAALEGDIYKL